MYVFLAMHRVVISKRKFYENKTKGQLISKANCQPMNSSKKQTSEFVVGFLEEMEDSKKAFRNYLTFIHLGINYWALIERGKACV